MTRLSDTQLVILNAACARPNGAVYPVTSKLTGGALQKVLASLLGKGLLAEVAAKRDDTVWRLDGEERPLTLAATPAAHEALGLGGDGTSTVIQPEADGAAQAATGSGKATKGNRSRGKPAKPAVEPDTGKAGGKGGRKAGGNKGEGVSKSRGGRKDGSAQAGAGAAASGPRSRAGTKQAELIAMLRRAEGMTVEEAVKAFGWQPHTVRGALYGALKKKLGLDVTSEKVEGRGRIYRIAG